MTLVLLFQSKIILTKFPFLHKKIGHNEKLQGLYAFNDSIHTFLWTSGKKLGINYRYIIYTQLLLLEIVPNTRSLEIRNRKKIVAHVDCTHISTTYILYKYKTLAEELGSPKRIKR